MSEPNPTLHPEETLALLALWARALFMKATVIVLFVGFSVASSTKPPVSSHPHAELEPKGRHNASLAVPAKKHAVPAKGKKPHRQRIEDRVFAMGKKAPKRALVQQGHARGKAPKHPARGEAGAKMPQNLPGKTPLMRLHSHAVADKQEVAAITVVAAGAERHEEMVPFAMNTSELEGTNKTEEESFEREGEHAFSTSGLTEAYLLTMMLVTASITFIYRAQGARVICCILIYLLALSTMKLSVKWVFVVYEFKFPKFVTALHLLASMVMGFFILLRRSWLHNVVMVVPTAQELFTKIFPLAFGFAVSLGANNIALVFCSAAFAEIIASTTPVVAVGMVIVAGLPFDRVLLGPTLLVVAGCAVSVVGEVNYSAMGLALCMLSNVMRAFKATLQQQLMTGSTKAKFDPCALLAWNCTASLVAMLVWSFATEGLAPWAELANKPEPLGILLSLLVSCANACVLNLSGLFVTKDLGAVGAQLVAQTKSVLTVLGGVVVFQETITRQELYGFIAVMTGTYLYSRMESRLKKERAEQAAGPLAVEGGNAVNEA